MVFFSVILVIRQNTREPFPLSDHKSNSLDDIVHLDMWGSYRVTSKDGYKYFLIVVDDYTRACWVYLIKTKDEVFSNFENFVNLIQNQFENSVKIIRNDNGTKFINNKFEMFCNSKGIVHQGGFLRESIDIYL